MRNEKGMQECRMLVNVECRSGGKLIKGDKVNKVDKGNKNERNFIAR